MGEIKAAQMSAAFQGRSCRFSMLKKRAAVSQLLRNYRPHDRCLFVEPLDRFHEHAGAKKAIWLQHECATRLTAFRSAAIGLFLAL
jgi:hypothetical protein